MIKTCGKCEQMKLAKTMLFTSAYCGATENELLVPHMFDGEKKTVTLTRVPDFCTNPNAKKSTNPAPKKEWVTIDISTIKEQVK